MALSFIAERIVDKLGSLAGEEINRLWAVKDELDKLKCTVSTIKAVLLDAEKQSTMSEAIKEYMKNLKEALYDAEDLLDDFFTESMSENMMAKRVRFPFSTSCDLKMGREIKAIREKLDDIEANKKFHIQVTVGTQVVPSERETHSYIGAEEVIGRDDDKVNIIGQLTGSNPEDNVSIISIFGIGGLGKTTLAQLVYNDDKFTEQFDLKMWVCVSDVFDVKIILENIIESATDRVLKNVGMDRLQKTLREGLNGKKYFLYWMMCGRKIVKNGSS